MARLIPAIITGNGLLQLPNGLYRLQNALNPSLESEYLFLASRDHLVPITALAGVSRLW